MSDKHTVTEKISYEIWLKKPDGTEGLAHFLTSPEIYTSREAAHGYADRYNRGQEDKPLEERKFFYVRTYRELTIREELEDDA